MDPIRARASPELSQWQRAASSSSSSAFRRIEFSGLRTSWATWAAMRANADRLLPRCSHSPTRASSSSSARTRSASSTAASRPLASAPAHGRPPARPARARPAAAPPSRSRGTDCGQSGARPQKTAPGMRCACAGTRGRSMEREPSSRTRYSRLDLLLGWGAPPDQDSLPWEWSHITRHNNQDSPNLQRVKILTTSAWWTEHRAGLAPPPRRLPLPRFHRPTRSTE